ncbi:MAG: tetratricopeptide repeat protein [Bryobacterales bacterium]|nr:tetratricopeptide repeat protein [Bryobacterales bacterium]
MPLSSLSAIFLLLWQSAASNSAELEKARDAQDRGALERYASQLNAVAAKQSNDAQALYRQALAESYLAEIAVEMGDKNLARSSAESGIKSAERLTALKPENSEYHRLLGTLCGQAVPGNVMTALKYGRCAQDELNKAVQLDPKSAMNYVSRGAGNYYLPQAMGGGADVAIKDFQKAIELDARSADAHLWLGIALRKVNRNAEAHKALEKAVSLNPARVWAKQQLAKTPPA